MTTPDENTVKFGKFQGDADLISSDPEVRREKIKEQIEKFEESGGKVKEFKYDPKLNEKVIRDLIESAKKYDRINNRKNKIKMYHD